MKVMIVDDMPANLTILQHALAEEHEIVLCSSGQECLDHNARGEADAYLLDVSMPEMDGFELCKVLRGIPDAKNKPILFLTALDSIEQKMTGYEVGGDDYITKPYDLREVCRKVNLHLERSSNLIKAEKQKNLAEDVARIALKQSSEMGVVAQFVERSATCEDYEQLANLTLSSLLQFGLSGSIQIRIREDKIDISDNGWPSELEVKLLDAAKEKGRIIDMGQRCILNADRVSILVRNLPSDLDVQGRLRDHLAILLTGVSARITSIEAEAYLKKQQDHWVNTALTRVCTALALIKDKFDEHDAQTTKIMDALMQDMELGMSRLALSEEQENYFLALVDNSMQRLIKLYHSGVAIDQYFAKVEKELEKIINDNVC